MMTIRLLFFLPLPPAAVVDLAHGPGLRDAVLTREHLDRWEAEHGRVPEGAFVLLRTGWAHHFTQHPDHFLGNFENEENKMFPGENERTLSRQCFTDP